MDNCGESRANTGNMPDFWGIFVIMRHRIGAGSALLLGWVMMIQLIAQHLLVMYGTSFLPISFRR